MRTSIVPITAVQEISIASVKVERKNGDGYIFNACDLYYIFIIYRKRGNRSSKNCQNFNRLIQFMRY